MKLGISLSKVQIARLTVFIRGCYLAFFWLTARAPRVSHRGRASSTRGIGGIFARKGPGVCRADVAAPMVGRQGWKGERWREREVGRASRRCSVAPGTKSPGATARQCRARDRGERTRISCVPCTHIYRARARLNTRLSDLTRVSRERTYGRACERSREILRRNFTPPSSSSSSSRWTIVPKKSAFSLQDLQGERSMSILKRGVSGSRGVFLLPAIPLGRNDESLADDNESRYDSFLSIVPLLFSRSFFFFFLFSSRPFFHRFCKSREVDNVTWLSVHRGDFLTGISHLSRFLFDVNPSAVVWQLNEFRGFLSVGRSRWLESGIGRTFRPESRSFHRQNDRCRCRSGWKSRRVVPTGVFAK